jgi:hypothetical protein
MLFGTLFIEKKFNNTSTVLQLVIKMELFVAAGVLHSHLLAPHGDGLGGDAAHGREGHLLPGKQCFVTKIRFSLF